MKQLNCVKSIRMLKTMKRVGAQCAPTPTN